MSRRDALRQSVLLSVAAGAISTLGATVRESSAQTTGSNIMVAYFTRSGNTRVIAGQIARALDADPFEIQPADAYPEDYEETVEQARQETEAGYRPPLRESIRNLGSYETVFLGSPIWGTTAPPVIRSFLATHDLSGKTLVPFITHGGYGLGSSLQVIQEHARQARLVEGFTLECDQERRTLNAVTAWLETVDLQR